MGEIDELEGRIALEDRIAELEEENRQLETRAEAAEQKVQDLTATLDEIADLAKRALR